MRKKYVNNRIYLQFLTVQQPFKLTAETKNNIENIYPSPRKIRFHVGEEFGYIKALRYRVLQKPK